MHYAVMYRTVEGKEITFKELYRTLDDAEESLLDSQPWLAEGEWVRQAGSSWLELTDGSIFIIHPED